MQDYGWLSLAPPVLTVLLAIWSRNILVSLGFGVFCGSLILSGYNPLAATLDMIEERIFVQISIPSNIQIIFTMMAIGGFIRLLDISGGARAFARSMTRLVSSPGRAQLSAWLSGLAIFFTDSGNALIIGPLFRPVFREFRICREKLAWILDSTASPICILVPFIGWGAYIMGLIEQAYLENGMAVNSLSVLIDVIPYQFYALLTLLSVPLVILTGRDFGLMARAQAREPASIDETEEPTETPPLSLFAVPITVLLGLIGTLLGWYAFTGDMSSIHVRSTLTIAYVCASIACAWLLFRHRGVSMNDSLNTFIKGTESMVFVVAILILAWSLGSVIKDLGTAQTLSRLVSDGMSPALLPAAVFALGAVVSLATGSSWGTFAILMALAVPVADHTGASMILTIAAVLSGGLFGDHTSPISDTTVLASIGADCPHIDHVSTQFSYALLTGSIVLLCYIIAGYYPTPLVLVPAVFVLFLAFRFLAYRYDVQTRRSELPV